MKENKDWEAKLNLEVNSKGEGKIQMAGQGKAIIVMLVAMMFREPELRYAVEEALAFLEKSEGDLQLLDKEEDHGVQTIEEFDVFWARVEDKSRSVKHIFKSEYYRYKDAITEAAKEVNADNWLIKKAQERIASYSNYSGD